MKKYPTAAGIDPEDAARALMGRTAKKSGTTPSGRSRRSLSRGEEVPVQVSSPRQESVPFRELQERDLVTIVHPDGTLEKGFRILPGGEEWNQTQDEE